ncbi:MAG: hypothetical protein J6386_10585 [Candidatus Synoicihabitans palmerolidicus]|nr:hypothetical protein [Candidatus Synoicihabitans palmerolidicus]
MHELSAHYGTTIVLGTATQPAIGHHATEFPIGLPKLREIVREPDRLFTALHRVNINTPM